MSTTNTKVEIPEEYTSLLENLNEFTNMTKEKNLLTCDADCRQNLENRDLYNNFLSQKSNLINAEAMFEDAEKEYIINDKGYTYYNDIKLKEYEKEADNVIQKMNQKFKNIATLIEEKIKNNDTLNSSLENIGELNSDYVEKVANLKEEIDENENTGNIANRITYYNNKKINLWCSINSYAKIFFWIMFVSYLLVSIIYKQYNKRHVQVALLLLPLMVFFNGHQIYRLFRG